jgi:hypothetical protein
VQDQMTYPVESVSKIVGEELNLQSQLHAFHAMGKEHWED